MLRSEIKNMKTMITTRGSTAQRSNWEAQKAKLKLAFPKLTAEDLNFDETRKNEMFSKLELKLGMTTNELQVIIETL
jgi:hypothetical protein